MLMELPRTDDLIGTKSILAYDSFCVLINLSHLESQMCIFSDILVLVKMGKEWNGKGQATQQWNIHSGRDEV